MEEAKEPIKIYLDDQDEPFKTDYPPLRFSFSTSGGFGFRQFLLLSCKGFRRRRRVFFLLSQSSLAFCDVCQVFGIPLGTPKGDAQGKND